MFGIVIGLLFVPVIIFMAWFVVSCIKIGMED